MSSALGRGFSASALGRATPGVSRMTGGAGASSTTGIGTSTGLGLAGLGAAARPTVSLAIVGAAGAGLTSRRWMNTWRTDQNEAVAPVAANMTTAATAHALRLRRWCE